jgi:hypothetical protein
MIPTPTSEMARFGFLSTEYSQGRRLELKSPRSIAARISANYRITSSSTALPIRRYERVGFEAKAFSVVHRRESGPIADHAR